jgi:adenylate cyclase
VAGGVLSASWLAGVRRGWSSGRAVLVRAGVSLLVGLVGANVIGAAAVFVVAVFVVPEPPAAGHWTLVVDNLYVAVAYVGFAVPVGIAMGYKPIASIAGWLPSGREPTREEQVVVLRAPRAFARRTGLLWAGATALFGGLAFTHSVGLGVRTVIIVGLSGMVTSLVAYRLSERLLREASGRALSAAPYPQRVAQSVALRAMMTWVIGTGGPVLGVVLLGIASLFDRVGSRHDLAFAMAILGGNCLLTGAVTMIFATRATADPILSVSRALARIEQGDLDVSVPVYDGTELGMLQSGFNRMVTGLREREELRDLFGRHVGVDVARRALEEGVELGGEQREVAVLFIDIVGSTQLAAQRAPAEVVELLNSFFGIVVAVVEADGGFVNKFEGDAALAIFGAPVPLDNRETCALGAARTLTRRVRKELAGCDFGVGVAAGPVVAGNIGATSRLEYTVIGDPVNEASRLAEVAKTMPGRVAASGDVVEAAVPGERRQWACVRELTLRGRADATTVYAPGTD